MKPFNIEEAKAGKPVVNRRGEEVEIYIPKTPMNEESAVVSFQDRNTIRHYSNGKSFIGRFPSDLFMKSTKKKMYLYVRPETGYTSTAYNTIDELKLHHPHSFNGIEMSITEIEVDV